MAKTSPNSINNVLTENWGNDTRNGQPYSGKAVREALQSLLSSLQETKAGAVWFDNIENKLILFRNQTDRDTYLDTQDPSLVVDRVDLVFSDTQRRIRVINENGSSNLYFATTADEAVIKASFVSQEKEMTATDWTDIDEDAMFSIYLDKGATGNYVLLADQIFIRKGETFSFDIRRFLESGMSRVKITAVGNINGKEGSLSLTVNLTSMYLSESNFTWYQPFIEGQPYNLGGMNIGGTLDKTMYIKVANEGGYSRTYTKKLGTNIYTSNPYYFSELEFPSAGTGIYNVDIWVQANDLETDHLNYNIMCVAEADRTTAKLVCVSNPAKNIINYSDNTLFDFAVYNGGSMTSNPHIKLESLVNTTPTGLLDEDMVNVPTGEAVAYTRMIEIESDEYDMKLSALLTFGNEQKVVYNVDNSASFPATSGAVFYLNAANHNNTQENRLSIINEVTKGSVTAQWENMAWVDGADGWTVDENGRKCLLLPAMTRCTIDFQPLKTFGSAKTIEITYKVRNAADPEEPVIMVCDRELKNIPTGESYWDSVAYPAVTSGFRNWDGNMKSDSNIYSTEVELENGVEYSLSKTNYQTSRIFKKNGNSYSQYSYKNGDWNFTCPDDENTYILSINTNTNVEANKPQLIKKVIVMASKSIVPSDFHGINILPENIIVHSRDLKTNDINQSYQTQSEEIVNLQITMVKNYKTNYGNLCKIFVNGVVKKEFDFANADSWTNDASIILGSESADLYVYNIRSYESGFGSMDAMKNWISTLPNSNEKKKAYNLITSVTDDSNVMNFDNCRKHANVITIEMLNGADLPHYGLQKSYSAFANIDHFWLDHPEWNFSLGNVEISGQGTTSMNYWMWNLRWRIDKLKDGQTLTIKYADGTTESYTKGAKPSFKFMGNVHKAIQRETAKTNYASSMQSHKMGETAMFNDVHQAIGLHDDTEDGRIAVYQEPFYIFQKEKIEGSDQYIYRFIGLFTVGPDKGDKATFGYDNKAIKNTLIHMEGTDHGVSGVGMDYPWAETSVVENEGGDMFISAGKGNAWEIGASGNKETLSDVQAFINQEFGPAYSVAYDNSTLILGVTDTLASINANPTAFGLNKDKDGHAYQRYEIFIDGEYDLYHLSNTTGKYVKTGVNLLTDLGVTASELNGKTLDEKTELFRERRRERFRANMENYWDLDDCLYHYCFCVLEGATDNGEKNTYPYKKALLSDTTVGKAYNRWRWRGDDFDTTKDIDNQGDPNKGYSIEFKDFTDDSKSAYVFKGENSVFWTLIHECYPDEIAVMGRKMLTAIYELSPYGSGTMEKLMGFYQKYFWDKAQDYFTKSGYNSDAELKYEDAWPQYAKGSYTVDIHPLKQSLGDHLEAEKRWTYLHLIYMMSKWQYGPFTSTGYNDTSLGRVSFRTQLLQDFDITPYMDLYPVILSGQSGVETGGRTKAGEVAVISGVGGINTNVYIMAADLIEDLGDLAGLAVDPSGSTELAVASKRLRTLKVGDEDAEKVTSTLGELTIGQCDSLTRIDARNLAKLTGAVDLTHCPRLQEALFGGTSATSIELASGARVTRLQLPSSLTALTLRNLGKLENLEYDNLNQVAMFRVENCPSLNPFQMLKDIYNADGNQLEGIRVVGFSFSGDASDVQLLANIANDVDKDGNAHDYRGIDKDGNITDGLPEIEGSISVNGNLYEDDFKAVQAKFPHAVIAFNGEWYLPFADKAVEKAFATKWGDGIGLRASDAWKVNSIGCIMNLADAKVFREYHYFPNVIVDEGYALGFNKSNGIEEVVIENAVFNKTIGQFWPGRNNSNSNVKRFIMRNVTLTENTEAHISTKNMGSLEYLEIRNIRGGKVVIDSTNGSYDGLIEDAVISNIGIQAGTNIPKELYHSMIENCIKTLSMGQIMPYYGAMKEIDLSGLSFNGGSAQNLLAEGSTRRLTADSNTKLLTPVTAGGYVFGRNTLLEYADISWMYFKYETAACFTILNASSLSELVLGNADFCIEGSAPVGLELKGCGNLTTISGQPKNISNASDVSSCPLTRESALVLINGLMDMTNNSRDFSSFSYTTTIKFSETTKALLTDEDKKIATDKGWTIA